MRVNLLPRLSEVLLDAKALLNKKELLFRRKEEADPHTFSLSFSSVVKTSTVKKFYKEDLCTLCSRRISYKHEQFLKEHPKQPYLLLVHNNFKPQNNRYYHDPTVNTLFKKIIETSLGHKVEDFLVREVLRCHFGSEELFNPEWFTNCNNNIQADVLTCNLKGILIIGEAAKFFLKSNPNLKAGEIFQHQSLPAMLVSGPSRIVYMQTHGYTLEQITDEKRRIFSVMQNFQKEVMKFANKLL